MELHGRCENNPNTSVGTGGSSPHPKMYLLKSGAFKLISFSVTCNVEGAVWQPWKLSPLFLHRTGIARAAAMQASPHCPANAPQPSSEEVTSGGEWVEESLCVQRLPQGRGSCRTGWMEAGPCSWESHQSLTDNQFMYHKAVWAGFVEVALFCLAVVTFWYFFVVGWHLYTFFFFLHSFSLKTLSMLYVHISEVACE